MSRLGAFAGFRGLRGVWRGERALGVVHRHADGARGHERPVGIARGAPDARDSGQMPREAEETAICWLQPRLNAATTKAATAGNGMVSRQEPPMDQAPEG
jgi:hypothetical protein